MKKLISLVLIVALLTAALPGALAVDNMAESIRMLSSFLSASESTPVDIDEIIDSFSQIGNINNAMEFKFYSMMVKYISMEDWDGAETYLKVLDAMQFDKYLTGEEFKTYLQNNGIIQPGTETNIRPTDEVKSYIEGRKALNAMQLENAYAAFLRSFKFYDAGEYLTKSMGGVSTNYEKQFNNAISLYKAGMLDDALQILVQIKDQYPSAATLYDALILEKKSSVPTPAPTAAPAEPVTETKPSEPVAATGSANDSKLSITNKQIELGITIVYWNEIKGAVKYTLYKRKLSGNKTVLYSGTETKGRDDDPGYGAPNYYYVVATMSDGREITSEEVNFISATQSPESNATPSPSAAQQTEPPHVHNWIPADCTHAKTCSICGATDGSELGHIWQDATCTNPKICARCGATEGSALGHDWIPATESAPKTCSRCGTTEGSKLTWGEWSDWSTTPISETSTRKVEHDVRKEETGTRTLYSYSRFLYYNSNGGYWTVSYADNWAKGMGYKGEWRYYSTYTQLTQNGTVDGVKRYNGPSENGCQIWYNQTTKTEPMYTDVTYYRYRELR